MEQRIYIAKIDGQSLHKVTSYMLAKSTDREPQASGICEAFPTFAETQKASIFLPESFHVLTVLS